MARNNSAGGGWRAACAAEAQCGKADLLMMREQVAQAARWRKQYPLLDELIGQPADETGMLWLIDRALASVDRVILLAQTHGKQGEGE